MFPFEKCGCAVKRNKKSKKQNKGEQQEMCLIIERDEAFDEGRFVCWLFRCMCKICMNNNIIITSLTLY